MHRLPFPSGRMLVELCRRPRRQTRRRAPAQGCKYSVSCGSLLLGGLDALRGGKAGILPVGPAAPGDILRSGRRPAGAVLTPAAPTAPAGVRAADGKHRGRRAPLEQAGGAGIRGGSSAGESAQGPA